MSLHLRPVSFREACTFVETFHRHHQPPQGHKFSIAAETEGRVIGVVMVGRPVARGLQDGYTAEAIRLCTAGQENACSFLYGAAARAAKELGYWRIITYILASEDGASLRASGWSLDRHVKGRSWNCMSRPRDDKHPTEDKVRYVRWLASWLQ